MMIRSTVGYYKHSIFVTGCLYEWQPIIMFNVQHVAFVDIDFNCVISITCQLYYQRQNADVCICHITSSVPLLNACIYYIAIKCLNSIQLPTVSGYRMTHVTKHKWAQHIVAQWNS